MKLPIAIATLLVVAGTALPAVAATPGPISAALRDAAATPIEAAAERTNAQVQQQNPGWGNCVSGIGSAASSAFPSWDRC